MAKRGPKPIGAEPMTPAERQRRRRAKLAATRPPRAKGRRRYDFLTDPERYLIALANEMMARGQSARKALALVTLARIARPYGGSPLPDGRLVLYAPPGASRLKIRNRIIALRWKLEQARRDHVAAEWLRIVSNAFALINQESDPDKRRMLMEQSAPQIIERTGPDFVALLITSIA